MQFQPVQSSHIYNEESVAAAPISQQNVHIAFEIHYQNEMTSIFCLFENDKTEIFAVALSQLPKKFAIVAIGTSTFKKRPLMPVTCQRAFTLTAELLLKKKVYEAEHIVHKALFVATKKGHTLDQLLKNYTDEVIMQDEDGQNALYVIYLCSQNRVNEPLSKKLAKIDFTENDLFVMLMIMLPYHDQ